MSDQPNEHGNSPSSPTCKCLGAIGAGLCCEDYCLVSFDGSGAGNPDSKMKRLLFQKNTQRLHTVPWWVHFVAEGKVLNAKNIWRAGHALKAQRFFTVSKGEHSLHVYHSIFM